MKIYRIANKFVYHGSDECFDGFDSSKQTSGYYPGFHVTIDPEIAKTFGNNISAFKLVKNNLYPISNNQDSEDLKQKARNEGYAVRNASGYLEVEFLKERKQ